MTTHCIRVVLLPLHVDDLNIAFSNVLEYQCCDIHIKLLYYITFLFWAFLLGKTRGNALRQNVIEVSHVLVHHKAKDSHLGGTSIVQFNGSLLGLPFIGLSVPSKVQESVTEVTREGGSSPGRRNSGGVLLVLVGGLLNGLHDGLHRPPYG